ncbi:ribbon-helix-helix protein, CopG family [uncultured Porticoccus sp.]|jgi:predicted transcriptional regulator|uniref:CopG family ribbon-helix-helix protein n=1 Tax=uncultured Porticoccus sp. TaxID=1256050 RepID=UPI0030D7137B|tara:strand:- start:444 stop:713 length:270 start_codon:yes stop_codon:yes gene_type:complete
MAVTSIRLQAELEEPLEVLAKKLDRSKNYLINQALKEFIAQQKLAEKRWQETLPALESVRAGRTIPADKVFEWMRSWGTDNELPKPKSE